MAGADNDSRARRSIICGVDGSADARLAVRFAAKLAQSLELRLVLAHVIASAVTDGKPGSTPRRLAPSEGDVRRAERLLEQVARDEQLKGAELRTASGVPAEWLADLADEEAAEIIVVGSRGHGALKRAFLGSVSHDLIGIARCPVVVVPRGVAVPAS